MSDPVVRTRADFEAWAATQPRAGSRVPGADHALFMTWVGRVLLAGERIEWDLPPLAVYAPLEAPCGAVVSEPAPAPAELGAELGAEAPSAILEPILAYTDGSGTIAERPCGAGVCVYDRGEVILEVSRHLGLGTNNRAELSAIGLALVVTADPPLSARELVIRSDSEYAIGAVTRAGDTDAHRPNAKLINHIRGLLRARPARIEWVKGHSKIEGNERADHLANLARLRGSAARSAA